MAKNILVVNGPNLNLLGTREPDALRHRDAGDDRAALWQSRRRRRARRSRASRATRKPSSSTASSRPRPEGIDFIIINPAAYTHTSVAMRDALAAVAHPVRRSPSVERPRARAVPAAARISATSRSGVISGLGAKGYELALAYALEHTAGRGDRMDLRKLKTLIDLVQQSGIAELEITEGEEKVRISRGVPGGVPRRCRSRARSTSPRPAPQPAARRAAPPAEPRRRPSPKATS